MFIPLFPLIPRLSFPTTYKTYSFGDKWLQFLSICMEWVCVCVCVSLLLNWKLKNQDNLLNNKKKWHNYPFIFPTSYAAMKKKKSTKAHNCVYISCLLCIFLCSLLHSCYFFYIKSHFHRKRTLGLAFLTFLKVLVCARHFLLFNWYFPSKSCWAAILLLSNIYFLHYYFPFIYTLDKILYVCICDNKDTYNHYENSALIKELGE